MIVDHPTLRYDSRDGWPLPVQVVQCDHCLKLADRGGKDAGEAADQAQHLGFKTVKDPDNPSGPRKWACGCHEMN